MKHVIAGSISAQELSYLLTPHDLKRLELYARNMVDYHLIADLLPVLARLYFLGRLPQVNTSYLQAAILLGLGLQHRYAFIIYTNHT
jgi:N-acetyltransferase 10